MKFLTIAVIIAIGLISFIQASPTLYNYKTENELDLECPQICPKNIDPICAYDGVSTFKYFHNSCLMMFNKCRSGKDWSPTLMSLCLHEIESAVVKDCLRPCPFVYEPICATDGNSNEIFSNKCVFELENCLSNDKWQQTRENECGL